MSFIEFLKQNKHDSEEKGISNDKKFLFSIAISFVAIIGCIVMLSATTYAWFSSTIESENTITTSVFKLDISVDYDNAGVKTTLVPTTDEKGNSVYELKSGIEYTVTASALSDEITGKTGYIRLRCGDKTLTSVQINRGDKITFTLKFSADTEITLIEGWGISSVPDEQRAIKDKILIENFEPKSGN